MARVTLISPFDKVNLGARSLSAVLKENGHSCRLLFYRENEDILTHTYTHSPRFTAELNRCSEADYGLIRDCVADFDTDILAFSLGSISLGLCIQLSERFRRDFPGVPIVWGGHEPTLDPEGNIGYCDYLAVGEAEESFLDLVNCLSGGGVPTQVQGMWAREGERIHRNPLRPLVQDLDLFPFADYEPEEKFLLQKGRLEPLLKTPYLIMTQRGCPQHCTFCINAVLKDIYSGQRRNRRRSVDHVMGELRRIRELYRDLDFVFFYDEIFTIDKSWVRQLAGRYREEIGLPFWCYIYPGTCDEEFAGILNEMGIRYACCGIESASEHTTKDLYERAGPERVIRTGEVLKEAGIPVEFDLIAGNPFESDEDHLATLETLLRLPKPFSIKDVLPLHFTKRSPLLQAARDQGVPLLELEGTGFHLAADQNHIEFWTIVWDLATYPNIDPDYVRRIARDEHLKRHPELVDDLRLALKESYWAHRRLGISKEDRMTELEARIEALENQLAGLSQYLGAIEGSRSYRVFSRTKNQVRSWFGNGNGKSGSQASRLHGRP
jgi:pyruvate-formate lyase-activating enzyme